MSLPYNGTISMGQVAQELGGPYSNESLTEMSVRIGLSAPHGLMEFYGYTRKSISFSGLYSIGYSGSVSGTVTIVGGTVNFSAGAVQYSGGNTTANINVNGNARSITRIGNGTSYSTAFQLAAGTYSYSFSVSLTGGGSGFINASWA